MRVEHIYRGDVDKPASLSPLAIASLGGAGALAVGDVITHVNGVPTVGAAHLNELTLGLAGQQVRLSVARQGQGPGDGGDDVIVVPITQMQAAALRYRSWELSRRDACEALSSSTVGYVHLQAMGGEDYAVVRLSASQGMPLCCI